MMIRNQNGIETKVHYKMYKAKHNWVIAGVAVAAFTITTLGSQLHSTFAATETPAEATTQETAATANTSAKTVKLQATPSQNQTDQTTQDQSEGQQEAKDQNQQPVQNQGQTQPVTKDQAQAPAADQAQTKAPQQAATDTQSAATQTSSTDAQSAADTTASAVTDQQAAPATSTQAQSAPAETAQTPASAATSAPAAKSEQPVVTKVNGDADALAAAKAKAEAAYAKTGQAQEIDAVLPEAQDAVTLTASKTTFGSGNYTDPATITATINAQAGDVVEINVPAGASGLELGQVEEFANQSIGTVAKTNNNDGSWTIKDTINQKGIWTQNITIQTIGNRNEMPTPMAAIGKHTYTTSVKVNGVEQSSKLTFTNDVEPTAAPSDVQLLHPDDSVTKLAANTDYVFQFKVNETNGITPDADGQVNSAVNYGTTVTIPVPQGFTLDADTTAKTNNFLDATTITQPGGAGHDIIITVPKGSGAQKMVGGDGNMNSYGPKGTNGYAIPVNDSYRIAGQFAVPETDAEQTLTASGVAKVDQKWSDSDSATAHEFTAKNPWSVTLLKAGDPGKAVIGISVSGNDKLNDKILKDNDTSNDPNTVLSFGITSDAAREVDNQVLYVQVADGLNAHSVETPKAEITPDTYTPGASKYDYELTLADGTVETGTVNAGDPIKASGSSNIRQVKITIDKLAPGFNTKDDVFKVDGNLADKYDATGQAVKVGDKLESSVSADTLNNDNTVKDTQTVTGSVVSILVNQGQQSSHAPGASGDWILLASNVNGDRTTDTVTDPIFYIVVPKEFMYDSVSSMDGAKLSSSKDAEGNTVLKIDYTGQGKVLMPGAGYHVPEINFSNAPDALSGQYAITGYLSTADSSVYTTKPDSAHMDDVDNDTNAVQFMKFNWTIAAAKGTFASTVAQGDDLTATKDATLDKHSTKPALVDATITNSLGGATDNVYEVINLPQVGDDQGSTLDYNLTGPITLPGHFAGIDTAPNVTVNNDTQALYSTTRGVIDKNSANFDKSSYVTADKVQNWDDVQSVLLNMGTMPESTTTGRIAINGNITNQALAGGKTGYFQTALYAANSTPSVVDKQASIAVTGSSTIKQQVQYTDADGNTKTVDLTDYDKTLTDNKGTVGNIFVDGTKLTDADLTKLGLPTGLTVDSKNYTVVGKDGQPLTLTATTPVTDAVDGAVITYTTTHQIKTITPTDPKDPEYADTHKTITLVVKPDTSKIDQSTDAGKTAAATAKTPVSGSLTQNFAMTRTVSTDVVTGAVTAFGKWALVAGTPTNFAPVTLNDLTSAGYKATDLAIDGNDQFTDAAGTKIAGKTALATALAATEKAGTVKNATYTDTVLYQPTADVKGHIPVPANFGGIGYADKDKNPANSFPYGSSGYMTVTPYTNLYAPTDSLPNVYILVPKGLTVDGGAAAITQAYADLQTGSGLTEALQAVSLGKTTDGREAYYIPADGNAHFIQQGKVNLTPGTVYIPVTATKDTTQKTVTHGASDASAVVFDAGTNAAGESYNLGSQGFYTYMSTDKLGLTVPAPDKMVNAGYFGGSNALYMPQETDTYNLVDKTTGAKIGTTTVTSDAVDGSYARPGNVDTLAKFGANATAVLKNAGGKTITDANGNPVSKYDQSTLAMKAGEGSLTDTIQTNKDFTFTNGQTAKGDNQTYTVEVTPTAMPKTPARIEYVPVTVKPGTDQPGTLVDGAALKTDAKTGTVDTPIVTDADNLKVGNWVTIGDKQYQIVGLEGADTKFGPDGKTPVVVKVQLGTPQDTDGISVQMKGEVPNGDKDGVPQGGLITVNVIDNNPDLKGTAQSYLKTYTYEGGVGQNAVNGSDNSVKFPQVPDGYILIRQDNIPDKFTADRQIVNMYVGKPGTFDPNGGDDPRAYFVGKVPDEAPSAGIVTVNIIDKDPAKSPRDSYIKTITFNGGIGEDTSNVVIPKIPEGYVELSRDPEPSKYGKDRQIMNIYVGKPGTFDPDGGDDPRAYFVGKVPDGTGDQGNVPRAGAITVEVVGLDKADTTDFGKPQTFVDTPGTAFDLTGKVTIPKDYIIYDKSHIPVSFEAKTQHVKLIVAKPEVPDGIQVYTKEEVPNDAPHATTLTVKIVNIDGDKLVNTQTYTNGVGQDVDKTQIVIPNDLVPLDKTGMPISKPELPDTMPSANQTITIYVGNVGVPDGIRAYFKNTQPTDDDNVPQGGMITVNVIDNDPSKAGTPAAYLKTYTYEGGVGQNAVNGSDNSVKLPVVPAGYILIRTDKVPDKFTAGRQIINMYVGKPATFDKDGGDDPQVRTQVPEGAHTDVPNYYDTTKKVPGLIKVVGIDGKILNFLFMEGTVGEPVKVPDTIISNQWTVTGIDGAKQFQIDGDGVTVVHVGEHAMGPGIWVKHDYTQPPYDGGGSDVPPAGNGDNTPKTPDTPSTNETVPPELPDTFGGNPTTNPGGGKTTGDDDDTGNLPDTFGEVAVGKGGQNAQTARTHQLASDAGTAAKSGQTARQLPQTGDAKNSGLSAFGLAIAGFFALLGFGKKRRNGED